MSLTIGVCRFAEGEESAKQPDAMSRKLPSRVGRFDALWMLAESPQQHMDLDEIEVTQSKSEADSVLVDFLRESLGTPARRIEAAKRAEVMPLAEVLEALAWIQATSHEPIYALTCLRLAEAAPRGSTARAEEISAKCLQLFRDIMNGGSADSIKSYVDQNFREDGRTAQCALLCTLGGSGSHRQSPSQFLAHLLRLPWWRAELATRQLVLASIIEYESPTLDTTRS